MAKQLTLDEMIESLILKNHPAAGTCQAVIEAIGTLMADTIAAALGVTAGPATFEGTAFAGKRRSVDLSINIGSMKRRHPRPHAARHSRMTTGKAKN